MTELYVVPEAIKAAAEHGDLVVFVGAGVSALCGSPNWQEFANVIVDQIGRPSGLTFLQVEQLRNISDPRRRLSIAIDIADRAGIEIGFESALHPAAGREAGLEAYRLLSALNPVFVTTDYDKWFSTTPPPDFLGRIPGAESSIDDATASKRQVFIGREQLTSDLFFKRGAVIHLHGSYTEPKTMIISLRDYIRHYSDPHVKSFLREMFNRTVLFVGYGLNDIEILEYVVKAATDDLDTTPQLKHHILYGYRSSEEAQTTFIESFFKQQCNIGVIKYPIDANGWEELVSVLRAWQPQLNTRDANVIEYQQFLDRCIENGSDSTQRDSAIRAVQEKPDLEQYLFNNLNGPEWFDDLERARFFDVARNPADGRWPAVLYLERVAGKLVGLQAIRLLAIIRAITEDSAARGIDNWITNWSLVDALSHLPTDLLAPTDIALVDVWLGSNYNVDMLGHKLGGTLLPRLLRDESPKAGDTALRLTEALAKGHEERPNEARAGDYHVREALKKNAELLGRRCKSAAVSSLAQSLIKTLGTPKDDGRNAWWRSAIEEHEQDRFHDDFKSALLDALRDATLGCLSEDEEQGRAAVLDLLKSEYPTIVRVGIYACGERYGEAGDLFWSEFVSDWIVDLPFWHEVYWLIRRNFGRFSRTQRDRFLDAVNNCKGDWSDPSKASDLDARHRRDLYHAAFEQGDVEVDALYRELAEIYGPAWEHVDFHIYTGGGWVGDGSPKSPAELLQLDAPELLRFLNDFIPTGGRDEFTRRGLATALADALRASEDGFSDSLEFFLDVDPAYQHGLFRGLSSRWKEDKKDIPWPEALRLARKIVISERFRELVAAPTDGQWEPNIHWAASDIVELIRSGLDDEKRSMPPDLVNAAFDVCAAIISTYVPNKVDPEADAVSDAINNPRGRAMEAMIRLLLHAKKLGSKGIDTGLDWSQGQALFDLELERSEVGENADFSALAVMYMGNLHYLAPTWVERNFDRLFSKADSGAWYCAAQGFAYQRYTYDWLYASLRDGGHLSRMIDDPAVREPVWERAHQFLMLAYLAGKEPMTGEGAALLPQLIQKIGGEKLTKVCWFLWSLRDSLDEAKRQLVLNFWVAISRRIEGQESTHAIELSALSQLAAHIEDDMSTEIVAAWKQAAPFAQVGHHDSSLVENLARLSKKFPEQAGQVFLVALDAFTPHYDPKDIIACVRQIARSGHSALAEKICTTYAERGSILLNPIYVEIREGKILGDPDSA